MTRSTVPVIVCFAGGNWDGNPHSRHHLMRRFAGEFEVLFVEGVPMRSVAVGARHELRRVLAKVSQRPRLRTVAPNLHVLRPVPIPPGGPLGRAAQTAALRVQVLGALRRLGLAGARVVWFSLPNVAPLLGRLGERGAVFYYQDRYDAFSHVDAAALRLDVEVLAQGCDVVITSARDLAVDLERAGARPQIVPHGVELERFRYSAQLPADLAELESPRVGYVGIIDDFVSFDHLRAVADRLQRGTVVLVGPTNVGLEALDHPRIAYLGPRPYAAVPSYLHGFACCLIPFVLNRLTRGINPIKLREYLAAGRPVVSTPLPEVVGYRAVIELAADRGAFAAAVLATLSDGHDTEEVRQARREAVADDSWDAVAATIAPSLRGLLNA